MDPVNLLPTEDDLIVEYRSRYSELRGKFSTFRLLHKQSLANILSETYLLLILGLLTPKVFAELRDDRAKWHEMHQWQLCRLQTRAETLIEDLREDLNGSLSVICGKEAQSRARNNVVWITLRSAIHKLHEELEAIEPSIRRCLDCVDLWHTQADPTEVPLPESSPSSPTEEKEIELTTDSTPSLQPMDSPMLSAMAEPMRSWRFMLPTVLPLVPLPPTADGSPWRCRL